MKKVLQGLLVHLAEHRSDIVKKVRYNERYERTGYSEYTQWDTLVSFDEIEVVDFDALLQQIDEFSKQFDQ